MQAGREFWAPHIEALERESLSTAEYAKRHGLALHSLYYWRHKVKAAEAPSGESEQGSAFVALTVSEPIPAQRPGNCTLVLGPGVRVELAELPAPEWLAALGRAVQGAR